MVKYQDAIVLYDIVQFSLLPLVGILAYSLTREKGWVITIIAETVILLVPAPAPGLGILNRLLLAMEGRPIKSVRDSSIVLSLLPCKTGRASWSGLFLGLAFFDPRFAVVALPIISNIQ